MSMQLRLKTERIKREWTQNDLAKKLGISPQTVCDWEKGRCFPRKQVLDNLENLFSLSHKQLFAVAADKDPFSSTN